MPSRLSTFAKGFLSVAGFVLVLSTAAIAQTSTITYQGRLSDGGTAPTGTYDMQFKLYDTPTVGTGTLQGSPNTVTNGTVNVTSGVFTVQLDFGAGGFPGTDRYLEINVRHPGDPSYTTLSPRQQFSSTPYAIRAATATNNVLKGGDTMTGPLVLSGDPTVALGAATRQYVDSGDALKLNLSGGTMAGALNLGGNSISGLSTLTASGTLTAGGLTLAGNGVITAPRVENSASDPAAASAGNSGRLYYNTGVKALEFSDGTTWQSVATATSGGSTAANFLFSYATTTQTVVTSNTFQDVTFDTSPQIDGWVHLAGTGSFTCPQTGVYLIQYSAEVLAGSANPNTTSLRGLLNGVEIAGSQASVLPANANLIAPMSKSFVAGMTAGDILKIQFTGSNASAQLIANSGNGTTRPSASVTIIKIQ
jgi:hypothetical protein